MIIFSIENFEWNIWKDRLTKQFELGKMKWVELSWVDPFNKLIDAKIIKLIYLISGLIEWYVCWPIFKLKFELDEIINKWVPWLYLYEKLMN